MIEFINVTFSYNRNRVVIDALSFNMDFGKIHALLGHNGAGKTTIIRLLLGLFNPDKGEVIINGEKPRISSPIMSYMPETNGIYEKLTAIENLKFRAIAAKLDKKDIQIRCSELLRSIGLEKRGHEYTGIWSNGMKKRLGLACALVSYPRILFLDEPTNGIDPESMEVVASILKEMQQNGTTIIISSHNLDFISEIANDILIIENGQYVYSGDIRQNKDRIKEIYFSKLKEFRER